MLEDARPEYLEVSVSGARQGFKLVDVLKGCGRGANRLKELQVYAGVNVAEEFADMGLVPHKKLLVSVTF